MLVRIQKCDTQCYNYTDADRESFQRAATKGSIPEKQARDPEEFAKKEGTCMYSRPPIITQDIACGFCSLEPFQNIILL